MLNFIFFSQPFRSWIINISDYIPGRFRDWILTRLYPGDAVISLVRRNS